MEVHFQDDDDDDINDDNDKDNYNDIDFDDDNDQVDGKHEPHRGSGGQDEDGLLLRKQPRTQRDQGTYRHSHQHSSKSVES